jgi:hypothetical protein
MGSFANSLHVRCGDADRVAKAIAEVLTGEGWSPTTRSPARATLGTPSPLRALEVSSPVAGWVSILDSDLMGIHQLAGDLAVRLDDYAIVFLVNDSDSWGYRLAHRDRVVDEFDTEPDEDDWDDELPEGDLAQLGQQVQALQGLMRDGSLQERMKQMSEQMMADAPPEIRGIATKMQTGQATRAEIQHYSRWSMEQMPKISAQIKELLGGALPQPAIGPVKKKPARKPTKSQQTAAKKRLAALRPLLAAGISDEQVQQALDARAVFAEESLANFLPLLGIPRHYAYLSYAYLADTEPAELAAQSIRFVHHLRYENNQALAGPTPDP